MRQTNIQVAAPGFLGVNLEDSPTNLDLGWSSVIDNAVIDESGRVASRKGYRILTADNTDVGSSAIEQIHEANYADGTTVRFACGNNKIFTFDTSGVLTDITGGATITADDWQIATLNDDTIFFQRGETPLIYDKSAASLTAVTAHTNYAATVPAGDVALAAYGRMWTAGVSGTRAIVHWSDLLIPAAWGGGTSGSLDCTNLWPNGNDEITAIAAHNNKLIIFGKHSTLIFGSSSADGRLGDPAADLLLEDTITDIGCVGKHAWVVVGEDLWFADYSGIRSLGRTIQEKSLPIGGVTRSIATRIRNQIRTEDGVTRMMYNADEAFVLVMFPTQELVWCIDTRQRMQDGSHRVTRWPGWDFDGMGTAKDGTLWFGDNNGINRYTGYIDAADTDGVGGTKFRFRWYIHPQTFDSPANLKIPKEIDFVIEGGSGQRAVAYWGFGYDFQFRSQVFALKAGTPDFYNEDEYNITTTDDPDDPTEYGSGNTTGYYSIPMNGSGVALVIGLEADVAGQKLSIQEVNIQTKIGRTT